MRSLRRQWQTSKLTASVVAATMTTTSMSSVVEVAAEPPAESAEQLFVGRDVMADRWTGWPSTWSIYVGDAAAHDGLFLELPRFHALVSPRIDRQISNTNTYVLLHSAS